MKRCLAILTLVAIALGAYQYRETLWPSQPQYVLSRVDPDFNAIGSSLKTYRLQAGFYPTTEQGLEALVHKPDTDPIPH